MREVWQQTLDEFVGDYKIDDSDLEDLDRTFGYEIDTFTRGWMPRTLRPVPSSPGFFFADIRDRPGDVALVQQDEVDGEYDVVGGYIEEFLWVDPGVRGRGLSAELVLAKADKLEGVMNPINYTSAGRGAHVSAHRLAVQRALREGLRVPARVLEDYPEFQAVPAKAVRALDPGAVAARLRARAGGPELAEAEPAEAEAAAFRR